MQKEDIILGFLLFFGIILIVLAFLSMGKLEEKESERIKLEIELEMLKKYYSCDNINHISPQEQELESFLLSIDRLNKNCGETFITKKYGSNEWSVFTALNENPYQLIKDCY